MRIQFAATSLLVAFSLAHVAAQSPPSRDAWFRPSAKPQDFRAARLPWKTFTIELPKDWQLIPAFGATLLTAAEKTRSNQATAAVFLEQMQLLEPVAGNDVNTLLAGLEADVARQRDPSAQNFDQQVKETGDRRFILLQYSRPGLNGLDRVVIYAIPVGRIMYRLICVAPADQLTLKYQAMFAHVASSFKPSVQTSN